MTDKKIEVTSIRPDIEELESIILTKREWLALVLGVVFMGALISLGAVLLIEWIGEIVP